MSIAFEAFSNEHQQDPYPIYRQLRDHAPIHRCEESGVWVLSRYEDVAWAFKTPEIFSSKLDNSKRIRSGGIANLVTTLRVLSKVLFKLRVSPGKAGSGRMLIQEDGDIHHAMRKIVNRGFTPSQILGWEPRVRQIARECMEGVRERGEFDLVQTLAIPLPVTVIAELVGVEPERRVQFKRWSDEIVTAATNSGPNRLIEPSLLDVMGEMNGYLRPIIRARRSQPQGDLISALVEAQAGEIGLSDYEAFLFIFLLMLAGNETTTNLIGNTIDALLVHTDQLAKVVADPTLVPALVEESLRYDSPVQQLTRRVTRAVTIHGVTLEPESEVQLLIGSANRDERRFPDPDRLDVSRDTKGHIGFGFGVHFCLGASLARLESRVALEALIPDLSGLVRARKDLELLPSNVLRGRSRLELKAA